MNASSSEVVAPASTELTTPAKSTPNATSAIATAASHADREASVPAADEHAARERERRLRLQPIAHRTREVDQQQHRERAERRERRDGRVADHLHAEREQRRHDQRGSPGPAQCREAGIALPQPVETRELSCSAHCAGRMVRPTRGRATVERCR